ncbi:MAG: DUF6188 family protein [Candidatus Acidiferrales bacterium]
MHGLDKDINLSFLAGRELIQVAIGQYQTVFAFDRGVAISIEGRFIYASRSEQVEWRPGASHAAAKAVALLGSIVDNFVAEEDGTLKLFFSNGDQLRVLDDSSEYESYQITAPGITIAV